MRSYTILFTPSNIYLRNADQRLQSMARNIESSSAIEGIKLERDAETGRFVSREKKNSSSKDTTSSQSSPKVSTKASRLFSSSTYNDFSKVTDLPSSSETDPLILNSLISLIFYLPFQTVSRCHRGIQRFA